MSNQVSNTIFRLVKAEFLKLRPGMAGAANDATTAETWIRDFSEGLVCPASVRLWFRLKLLVRMRFSRSAQWLEWMLTVMPKFQLF